MFMTIKALQVLCRCDATWSREMPGKLTRPGFFMCNTLFIYLGCLGLFRKCEIILDLISGSDIFMAFAIISKQSKYW